MNLSTSKNAVPSIELQILKLSAFTSMINHDALCVVAEEMDLIISDYTDVESTYVEPARYESGTVHSSMLKQLIGNLCGALTRYCEVRTLYPVQFNSSPALANRQLFVAAKIVTSAINLLTEETAENDA